MDEIISIQPISSTLPPISNPTPVASVQAFQNASTPAQGGKGEGLKDAISTALSAFGAFQNQNTYNNQLKNNEVNTSSASFSIDKDTQRGIIWVVVLLVLGLIIYKLID